MTAADRVFQALRSDILSGQLSKNDMLSIYRLADQYKVSRTPVREAVLKLESLGLVTVQKNHGVRVNGLSASDISDIFKTRILIEVPAAYHAAQSELPGAQRIFDETVSEMREAAKLNELDRFINADRALHDLIVGWTGNRRAVRLVSQLRDETQALGASTYGPARTIHDVLCEHLPIIEAISSSDSVGAARAMKNHLELTASLLLAKLGTPNEKSDDLAMETPILFLGI